VKTSILFIDRNLGKELNTVQFVEVKNTGFSLGASKKVLVENDLPRTIGLIHDHLKSDIDELTRHATVVEKSHVENSGFNLSESLYKANAQVRGDVEYVRLSEVCRVQKGKSSSTKSEPGPYPLILTAEFSKTSSTFDFSGVGVAVPLISATGHGKADVRRVHIVEGEFALANLLAFVEPVDPKQVNPRFLFHVLNGNKDGLAQLMKGAANVSMKVSDLEMFRIPLPPLEVQEQIVFDLDGYAAIISGAKQIVENWKPTFDLDPEWPVMKLQDVAKWTSGGTPKAGTPEYYDGEIPWSVIGDLNEDVVIETKEKITEKGLSESSAKILPKGTVMLAMYGASIGKTGIMGKPMATNQAIACGQVNPEIMDRMFLLYFLQGQKSEFVGAGAGGAQPNISQGIVKEWPVPVPPLSVQEQILLEIAEEKTHVDSAKKLIETYEAKTQAVIAKLWSE
jgi:restriction endonuclease S subunit